MKLEVVIFKKLAEFDLDVCFESHEDRLVLMGPSGSGKSMVLKCIAGIITPDAGRIVLDDEVLFDSNLKINISPQKRKIGYMFQNYALFDHMNVYQNIAAPLKAHHEDKQVIKEKVQQIMEDFQIDDLQKRYPRQLSGGQKQRVAIARALASNPKILLCDEATSALDPTTTKAILALLKEINQKYGITIVIITHEMAVVQEIGTHVAIIDHGELAESGTVEEVFTHPKSKAARKLVLMDDDNHYDEMKGQHCIRIVFKSNSSFEPVIANMVLAHRMPVNILLADTKDINGVAHGQMILQLPEDTTVAQKTIQYLKDRNLEVEELDHYVG